MYKNYLLIDLYVKIVTVESCCRFVWYSFTNGSVTFVFIVLQLTYCIKLVILRAIE